MLAAEPSISTCKQSEGQFTIEVAFRAATTVHNSILEYAVTVERQQSADDDLLIAQRSITDCNVDGRLFSIGGTHGGL